MFERLSYLTKGLFLASALFLGTTEARAIDIVIKATAMETKLGFTEGDEVTFRLTLNPAFVSSMGSNFNGSMAVWGAQGLAYPSLYSSVEISGVTGSFNPVLGDEPISSFSLNNLGGVTAYLGYESLGYQTGGQAIVGISTSFILTNEDLFDLPGSYVDPNAYLSGYKGVYGVDETMGLFLMTMFEDEVDSVEFSASEFLIIPEPASAGLLLFGGAGVFLLGRRRRVSRQTISSES